MSGYIKIPYFLFENTSSQKYYCKGQVFSEVLKTIFYVHRLLFLTLKCAERS